LMQQAVDAVPACSCREMLQQLVRLEAKRLIPMNLPLSVAANASAYTAI